MLIFDQLKRNDPQMRVLTLGVLAGLLILFGSLWRLQVLSASHYREKAKTQSFRTVRIPGQRGQIVDRNGVVLVENRPSFNVNLYLKELRKSFQNAFAAERKKLGKTKL